MDETTEEQILRTALHKWGATTQIGMFHEEAGEAITAINHYRRGRCDVRDVLGELADLEILLHQMAIFYTGLTGDNYDAIYAAKLAKLQRLVV